MIEPTVDTAVAEVPLDIAVVTALTGILTYGARKLLTRKNPAALDDKPQVLFWVSAAASIAGGGVSAVLNGHGIKEGVMVAAGSWLSMQGLRRMKKGAGIA